MTWKTPSKDEEPRLVPAEITERFIEHTLRAIDLYHIARALEVFKIEIQFQVNGYAFARFDQLGKALKLSHKDAVEKLRIRTHRRDPENEYGGGLLFEHGVFTVTMKTNDAMHRGVMQEIKDVFSPRRIPVAGDLFKSPLEPRGTVDLSDLPYVIAPAFSADGQQLPSLSAGGKPTVMPSADEATFLGLTKWKWAAIGSVCTAVAAVVGLILGILKVLGS